MNKRKSRKAKEQLNVTFHHEKDFTGLSSNKIMSPTQVPRSLWLTASCTFIRQCDTKPRGLLSNRVSSRKLAVLIPLFMSGTEKKFWSDGILQQCHLHPLGAGWTWDMGRFVRRLCCASACSPTSGPRARVSCPPLPRTMHTLDSCCPGEAVSAGQENPREMVGWFTGYLILFIFWFYFSEERKAFKENTSFCVASVRSCSEMSHWASSDFAPRQKSKWN